MGTKADGTAKEKQGKASSPGHWKMQERGCITAVGVETGTGLASGQKQGGSAESATEWTQGVGRARGLTLP